MKMWTWMGLAGAVSLAGGLAAPDSAAQPAPAGARALSFSEAESLALEGSPELRIAAKGIDAAELRVDAARALRLPRLSVEANLLVWNEEIAISLGIPGMEPPPGMDPGSIVVRDQVTSTLTATVAQPLSAQIAVGKLIDLEEAGVSAAREDREKSRQDVAYRVADGYLTVLLARAGHDVASLRVEQVTAQLDQAKKLVVAGLLEPVDTMRLEAALAAVQGDLIQANARVELARSALVLAIGLPSGTAVEVRDEFPAEPALPTITLDDAVAAALANRPDLRALAYRTEQAKSGALASKAELYPNVLAIATVQRNEGQGSFSAKNAWFVGLTLNWDVWDWGNRWDTYKEARTRAEQAALGAERFTDQVRLEVGNAFLTVTTSYETLAVTRAGLRAAEEAYRIQKTRFDEGVATTTDLLDADTDVSRARLGYASARYSYFRALVALARVTGQLPSALVAPQGESRQPQPGN